MAFKRSFAVLFLLAISVLASPSSLHKRGQACSADEFWYSRKNCCLPHGGPKERHEPPSHKRCPPTTWYWHPEKSCCVPNHPQPPHHPPPQCFPDWDWDEGTQCCEPTHRPTTTHHHRPSQTPKNPYDDGPDGSGDGDEGGDGYGDDGPDSPDGGNIYGSSGGFSGHYKKRTAAPLCPNSLKACPIPSLTSEYECADTEADLKNCGGCVSDGTGQDCNKIDGARNVGCERGSCAVYTCMLGYKVARDGKSCVKN